MPGRLVAGAISSPLNLLSMKSTSAYVLAVLVAVGLSTTAWGQVFATAEFPVFNASTEAQVSLKEGLRYFDVGENKKAKTYFTKAVEQDPSFVLGYIYLANTASSPKEWAAELKRARLHTDKASDWEKLVLGIEETYLTDDAARRMTLAKEMVERYPKLARSYLYLGSTYSAQGDYANARASFQKAIDANPTWPAGHLALAQSYLFNDPQDAAQAEQHAKKVAELAPANAGPYIWLGDTYRAQDKFDEAAGAYSKAIELDTESEMAYYKRGHVHFFKQNFDEARRDYLQAGRLDETPSQSIIFVANTYLYGNEPKTAQHLLWQEATHAKGAAAKAVTAAEKINLLNAAAMIAFHHQDAKTLASVIKEYEPASRQIARDLGAKEAELVEQSNVLFLKGQAAVLQGNYTEAIAIAEKMKKLKEPINNPRKGEDYHRLLGHVYYAQKDYAKAIEHFNQTDKTRPYDKYWRAKTYEAAGQADQAMALYTELAPFNFNTVGVALVKREVMKKVGKE